MNEISYNNWVAMTDDALIAHVGDYIKHHRLQQNRSQTQVATDAGISRSTLSLLERGEDVRLSTLLQVLRVLDLLHILSSFNVQEQLSPLAIAKAQHGKRYRARPIQANELNDTKSDW